MEEHRGVLKKVIPVAEECGVVMALHPDDPPYPIFGLPRVITCEENLDRYLSIVDSPSNALCLCTGSLGCAKFNDVPPWCGSIPPPAALALCTCAT